MIYTYKRHLSLISPCLLSVMMLSRQQRLNSLNSYHFTFYHFVCRTCDFTNTLIFLKNKLVPGKAILLEQTIALQFIPSQSYNTELVFIVNMNRIYIIYQSVLVHYLTCILNLLSNILTKLTHTMNSSLQQLMLTPISILTNKLKKLTQ